MKNTKDFFFELYYDRARGGSEKAGVGSGDKTRGSDLGHLPEGIWVGFGALPYRNPIGSGARRCTGAARALHGHDLYIRVPHEEADSRTICIYGYPMKKLEAGRRNHRNG